MVYSLTDQLLHRDLSRRALLQSALFGSGALSWPQVSRGRELSTTASAAKRRSLILLWQDGGPSHFETFDPKPYAPIEYRGALGAIATSLPGIAYCEVLPRLARLADRTCVIRSLHQPSSDHVVGSHNVLTGWEGESEGSHSRYPDVAAVISRMRSGIEGAGNSVGTSTDPRPAADESRELLPSYIDLGGGLHRGGPAFLGSLFGPFQVAGDPSKPGFMVQNLQSSVAPTAFHERVRMLERIDRFGQSFPRDTAGFEQPHALQGFRRQAIDLLSGGSASRAFDLSRESTAVRERYGLHLAGQQCLLARRLVESDVSVVGIRFSPDGRGDYDRTMIGWDDHAVHGNIFEIMRQRGPQFDQAVSALIEDLEDRGMRDEVLVVVMGEFGRTPRVQAHRGCPGRDHWGPAGCALVYGGGLEMGQIVGSTNDKGEQPQDRPLTYPRLLATIYRALGIDPAHMFINHSGRPVSILSDDEPIAELAVPETPQIDPTPRASTPPRVAPSRNAERLDSVTLPPNATNLDLASIPNLGRLQTLILHDSQIDDDGLAAIGGCHSLRRLELNGTPISDAGLSWISRLSALEELNLTGARITSAGLAQLRPLKRLRRLTCNGAPIALSDVASLFVREQGRPLTEALQAMGLASCDDRGNILTINVAGTDFGDSEAAHLGPLDTLRELHLAATRITDAGMERVGRLVNLERLYLAKCDVGDAGLAHVSQLERLQALNLYGTRLTSAGIKHLMRLSNLRTLAITDLKLDPEVVENLKSKLPGLTVTDFTAA